MKYPLLLFLFCFTSLLAEQKRPNILWLTAEDHGPHLGCYGDQYATTPNLDKFAKRSLLYANASSNAPICAPARTTLITGIHSSSLGAHHMRSEVERPQWLTLFPDILKAAGYYCSNNLKTDYNLTGSQTDCWNESSNTAHYEKRPEGTPFFAVFNQTSTHESQLHNENKNPHHDPAKAPVPPYHPDTPEVRKDWAQYYDRLTQMDKWFGEKIIELEKNGLAENTIVFFFSDHGSGMPRHKRYVGWSGLHIPLLVYIPDTYKHLRPKNYKAGGISNRLVSFVDFAPTILSLCGIDPVSFHQGASFLGSRIEEAPQHSFGYVGRAGERPDESRSTFDGQYLYIRNFMPQLPQLKGLKYQMLTKTTSQWKELYTAGKLNSIQAAAWEKPRTRHELYDLKKDPHETVNLANELPEITKRLSQALNSHMTKTEDLGRLPESLMHQMASEADVSPADLPKTKTYRSLIDSFEEDEDYDKYFWRTQFNVSSPTEIDISTLEKQLKKQDQTLGKILILERLLSLQEKTEYIDQLFTFIDPEKYSPYLALRAYQVIGQAKALTKNQYAMLESANLAVPKNFPNRVSASYKNFKPALLKQFKEAKP